MPKPTEKPQTGSSGGGAALGFPAVRCFSKNQAAAYLGVGVTLLTQLQLPFIKIGRRCVYDRVDLDAWLDEYKSRGRAGKEVSNQWPVKLESTGAKIRASGGLIVSYPTAGEYAKVLGLKTDRKPKRS